MSSLPRSSIIRSIAAAVLFGSLYASAASATTTIGYGSLPQEPVNGVTVDGVTFGYTEFGSASPEALFNVDIGAGNTQNVDEAALVGFTDGILTLNFASPVSHISFAAALTTNASLTPGFSVSVFDAAGDVLDSTNVDTTPLAVFSEGEFSYDGADATSVAISFDSVDANEFALGSVTVPEPASLAMFTVGLLALGTTVVRRRKA
jgi:hypothetical protein